MFCEIDQDSQNPAIMLGSIYAPNKDTPSFFCEIEEELMNYCENKIIVGDYNLVLNTNLDRLNSHLNNVKACEKVCELMQTLYLTNVWRDRNPDVKRYSWRNKHSASRIDNTLISQGLDSMVTNCTYLQGILTDHSAMYICVKFNTNERGSGYWKMNQKLLENAAFKDEIAEELSVLCDRY